MFVCVCVCVRVRVRARLCVIVRVFDGCERVSNTKSYGTIPSTACRFTFTALVARTVCYNTVSVIIMGISSTSRGRSVTSHNPLFYTEQVDVGKQPCFQKPSVWWVRAECYLHRK